MCPVKKIFFFQCIKNWEQTLVDNFQSFPRLPWLSVCSRRQADARALVCASLAYLRGQSEGSQRCPAWIYHSCFFSSSGYWAPGKSLLISPTPSLLYFKIPLSHFSGPLRMEGEERHSGVGPLPASHQLSVLTPHIPAIFPYSFPGALHSSFSFIYYFQLWGLSRIRFGGWGWQPKLEVSHPSRMRSALFLF